MNTQKIFGAESNLFFVGFDRPQQQKPEEVDKSVNVEMKIGFGSTNSIADGNVIQDTGGHSFKENVLKCGVPEQKLQLPHEFSTSEAILHKVSFFILVDCSEEQIIVCSHISET